MRDGGAAVGHRGRDVDDEGREPPLPLHVLPVALAPLGLAGIAWLVARSWFDWFRPSLPTTLALYAACFVLLYNALPSRQDLRVALNWKSLLLYVSLAAVVALFIEWPRLRHFIV